MIGVTGQFSAVDSLLTGEENLRLMAARVAVSTSRWSATRGSSSDEPTTGLDPRSRRTMWQIIRDLVDRGVTILLTTHYLEEADQLADQVAVLDQGRLIIQGTPDELKGLVPGGHVRLQFADMQGLASAARVLTGGIRDDEALTLQVPSEGDVRGVRALLDRLDRESIDVERISLHTPDLDDVFLALTGHSDEGRGPRS